MAAQPSTADDFARRVCSFAAHAVYTPNHAPKGSLKKQNRRFQAALLCKQRQPETTMTQIQQQPMAHRRLTNIFTNQ